MRILIADDDRELACAIASFLRHSNEAVVSTVTTGGLDVLRNIERFEPDVIIMDIMMPRLNGVTICHQILSRRPKAHIVLLSGILNAQHPLVVQSGAGCFLPKPVRLAELRNVVQKFINPPVAA